ncbi:hypothetical protein M3661_29430 [Paenibacillus sp. MER 180]|uniref:hypothetical protein n=1 Tax=Paenibacillus sp. MER 180 TaxID=2939570 RepID=UPI00203CB039|nr:hypothetical protein [Paenibacillus sp. MER 180]MCM3294211.1 hypothetical protein [Paenibacillus sp. MER 180]
MQTCALCKNITTLKGSHIIPKFVTEWIKKTGITGYLRKSENDYKRREQDGFKKYLLCEKCEGLFSKTEKKFAETIFIPYLKDNQNEFEYQEWLNYFVTSVNWRLLYLELIDYLNKEIDITQNNIEEITKATQDLGGYLLGEKSFPSNVESHIYFLNDLAFVSHAHLRPISFFRRSIFGFLLENNDPFDYSYVYSNLSGILLVTTIKKTKFDIWRNTLIRDQGKLTTNQLIGSPVLGDLISVLEHANEGSVPEHQSQKILEHLKNNEDKIKNSKFIEEFIKDQDLQELYRKLFKEE